MISREIKESLEESSWIRKMFEEGSRLKSEVGEDKVFDFTLGNPYGPPPEKFYESLSFILSRKEAGMHAYMPNAGYPQVRETKASELQELTGRTFSIDSVIMTAGAAGGINVALKALLDRGDEVVILSPYFVEYIFYIRNHGGIPVICPTGDDFEPDLGLLEKNLTKRTKAIIINSPNNPTGKIYGHATLSEMGEMLERFEKSHNRTVYVISDEPYREVVYEGEIFSPPGRFIRNCLIVYSNSKDLNIPGERIGYAALPPQATGSGEILEAMVFANRTLGFVNAPALMQRVSGLLTGVKPDMAAYRENRKVLYEIFSRSGLDLPLPGGAFYFFPPVPRGMDELSFIDLARQHLILLVPGSGFGKEGFFRVAYCASTDMVKRSTKNWESLFREIEGMDR